MKELLAINNCLTLSAGYAVTAVSCLSVLRVRSERDLEEEKAVSESSASSFLHRLRITAVTHVRRACKVRTPLAR